MTAADRATGMPTTSTPGRNLERATIGVETYNQDTATPVYFIDATVDLAGLPSGDPDAELNLGFGHLKDNTCVLAALMVNETSDYSTSYEFVGYTPDYLPAPKSPWNCIAVVLDNGFDGEPATATYDAFVGKLKDTRRSPQLKITRIDLLGQKLKSLKLVRGVPTRFGIELKNSGEVSTGKLTIKGSGKGLRVKRVKLGPLESDRSTSATVTLKLTGRRKMTRARIIVGDGSARAVRNLKVVRVRPPRRPLSGQYRSKSGNITFAVRRGRIVGWRGTMTTRCGGYPDNFYYTTNTYSHPATRVARNGIAQSTDRADLYSTYLALRIIGGRATQGHFIYSGPARCVASVAFTANRIRQKK